MPSMRHLVGLSMGLALLAAPADGAGKASAATSSPTPWLADALAGELAEARSGRDYQRLQRQAARAMVERTLLGPIEGQLGDLAELVHTIRAAEVLPAAARLGGEAPLADWLRAHPALLRPLLRALTEVPDRQAALARLEKLRSHDTRDVLAYPQLAVAFATTQPLRHVRPPPDACSLVEAFRWYTDADVPFRHDLKDLPYELLRFLADSRLNLSERAWAVRTYAAQRKLAKAYFDLRYDIDHLRKGTPKRIASLEYTLANLRKVGGVCIEQAYYAAEVCKALGVPAAIVVGRGASGVHHAWFAHLAGRGNRLEWDTRTGRYPSQKYFIGVVRNPADGGQMLDAELALYGAAAQLPLARRRQADAATASAALLAERIASAPGDEVKLTALKALRKRHLQRLRKDPAPAGQPPEPIDLAPLPAPVRPVDMDLVEDLLDAAIEKNLAHRPAWELLARLREARRIPVDHLDRFFDVLVTRTAGTYPDFSYVMIMRIVATIDDADRREKVYERAFKVYARRPDLAGRILLAAGDDSLQQGDKAQALRAYQAAAERTIALADVMLQASRRAEELYLDAGRPDLAIRMYQALLQRTRRRRVADVFQSQTSHSILQQRLAELKAGR